MSEFPTLVYRCPGACSRPGGTYGWLAARDAVQLDALLASGWFRTLPEAIACRAEASAPAREQENAPPTREELVQRAAELGIKVDGRWSDARLADEIAKRGT